jgi:acyl-CoA thioester hydrolase
MGAEFRHTIRVRYRECDMQGHVFFAEYAAYLDVAVTELWRDRAGGWQTMVDGGHDLVVAELQARYLGSAVFDDVIDVVLEVEQLGSTSMTTAWRVERDGAALVTGTVRYVCIDPVTHAKKPLPDELRAVFAS